MNDDQIYSLCEAVADIAFIAGEKNYYRGDSRKDISDFITWAKEFEEKYKNVEWGVDYDYIETIEKYVEGKLFGY